jgi:hypothetical protein
MPTKKVRGCIPGQIQAVLGEGYTQDQLKALMAFFPEIKIVNWIKSIRTLVLKVPEGKEGEWVEKLENQSMIKSASLVFEATHF